MSHLHKGVRVAHFLATDTGVPDDAYMTHSPERVNRIALESASDALLYAEVEKRQKAAFSMSGNLTVIK